MRRTTDVNDNLDRCSWMAIHGTHGNKNWAKPKMITRSDLACRTDQGNRIPSHEYEDQPKVFKAKCKLIANLIRRASCCGVYAGAGLSKASGIPDYASKKSVILAKKLTSNYDAKPTYAHKCIVALERASFIDHFVQQNHDGLPQKAGFPQTKINEIHGGWFDPSNPVVKFSGSLRDDLYAWMEELEEKIDLCLCLGTSLSGMNADRMATTPAEKAAGGVNGTIGTVLINLQKTPLDKQAGHTAVRLWGTLDKAFRLILAELSLSPAQKPKWRARSNALSSSSKQIDVFWIPYNAAGQKDGKVMMKLDLSCGARIAIAHPCASNFGKTGKVLKKHPDGHFMLVVANKRRRLGPWWLHHALKGELEQFPIRNIRPVVIPRKEYAARAKAAKGKAGTSTGQRRSSIFSFSSSSSSLSSAALSSASSSSSAGRSGLDRDIEAGRWGGGIDADSEQIR